MKKLLLLSVYLALAGPCAARIITVDDDGPADFNNIQAAIDDANDGDIVEVNIGTYSGPGNYDIDFLGKAITVRSTNPNDWSVVEQTVIDPNSQGIGFYLQNNEDANSILDGITIRRGRDFFLYDSFGGIVCVGGSAIIRNCIVTECFGDGIALLDCNVAVENCIITKNRGWFDHIITGSGIRLGGTGIFNIPTIKDCIISDNYQSGVKGAGGYIGGYATIINCLFSDNKGDILPMSGPEYISYGGGVFLETGGMSLINCTFVGNKAGLGGAICCRGSVGGANLYRLNIENCIIRNNHADYGQQIAVQYIGGAKPELNINHSNIQGGKEDIFLDYGEFSSALNWQTGNIDVDPCFVDPGKWAHKDDVNIVVEPNDPNAIWVDGDYHLKSRGWRWDVIPDPPRWRYDYVTSRCIDAGNPGSPLGDELLTIPDDPPHIWGENLRINMGAYGGTAQASMPPYDWALLADITNDGMVDGCDYAHQARDWLTPGTRQPGDLNRNGIVRTNDVGLFVADWLKTTTWHE
ncbi:MAG: hypothetical protein ACYSTF_05740 [Planctomycetota bacterium]